MARYLVEHYEVTKIHIWMLRHRKKIEEKFWLLESLQFILHNLFCVIFFFVQNSSKNHQFEYRNEYSCILSLVVSIKYGSSKFSIQSRLRLSKNYTYRDWVRITLYTPGGPWFSSLQLKSSSVFFSWVLQLPFVSNLSYILFNCLSLVWIKLETCNLILELL